MLRIQCFNQFAVRRGDDPVGGSATQPRRLAVLAILARAGPRGIPRDTVLRLLWPDEDEEKGRRVLSQAVYRLKRDLGSEEVIEGGRVLMLNALEISSDVQQFERAVAERRYADAARLYDGPFLDGFSLSSAPEFMRWVDDSRDALALAFADAVERAAGEATQKNDPAEAAALWRRRAGADALDGRVALKLMEALDAAGDRAGAIRHATIHSALVEQELGESGDAAVLKYADVMRSRGAGSTPVPPSSVEGKAPTAPAAPDPPTAAEPGLEVQSSAHTLLQSFTMRRRRSQRSHRTIVFCRVRSNIAFAWPGEKARWRPSLRLFPRSWSSRRSMCCDIARRNLTNIDCSSRPLQT